MKVAHTSLVCMVKSFISYQSKKLWVIEKHFSSMRFSLRCDFCNFPCYFWHFNAILQTQWVNWMIFSFIHVFYVGFEALLSLKFFHLSKFRNQISPPNVLLVKFGHLFSTLKYYNLVIYKTKITPNLFHVNYNTYTTKIVQLTFLYFSDI